MFRLLAACLRFGCLSLVLFVAYICWQACVLNSEYHEAKEQRQLFEEIAGETPAGFRPKWGSLSSVLLTHRDGRSIWARRFRTDKPDLNGERCGFTFPESYNDAPFFRLASRVDSSAQGRSGTMVVGGFDVVWWEKKGANGKGSILIDMADFGLRQSLLAFQHADRPLTPAEVALLLEEIRSGD